jgi:hypothetical protein
MAVPVMKPSEFDRRCGAAYWESVVPVDVGARVLMGVSRSVVLVGTAVLLATGVMVTVMVLVGVSEAVGLASGVAVRVNGDVAGWATR